jgi:hypothetical protein
MDALKEATAALRAAEQQLRSIIAKAAEGGDYDHLPRIAEWAKLLSAAISGQPVSEPAQVQPVLIPTSPSDNGVHARAAAVKTRIAAPASRKAKAGRRNKIRRRKKTNAEYPKFIREGDSLVKIGWSKSEAKTYEHKAPRSVIRALVQALVRVGSGGKRFTVEHLLPLKDSGSEIPDYQTYLTLAWLRSVDLITQHGRQGYSLLPDMDIEQESNRHWDHLDTR